MKLRSIAFWFSAISVVRFALAFLFFSDRPKIATFLSASISLLFAFILMVLRLVVHRSFRPLPLTRAIRWAMAYIAWAGLSLIWTFSDTLLSAFGFWAGLLLDVLIVMALL
jgi:hypothetical protein